MKRCLFTLKYFQVNRHRFIVCMFNNIDSQEACYNFVEVIFIELIMFDMYIYDINICSPTSLVKIVIHVTVCGTWILGLAISPN